MTRFRVIDGGLAAGEEAPINWGRQWRSDSELRALVIRDAGGGCADLAYDDGRIELTGIRTVCLPADQVALRAWCDLATAKGLEIKDERASQPLFDGELSMRAALELEQQRRAACRDSQRPPAGGLFDEVRRNQKELF